MEAPLTKLLAGWLDLVARRPWLVLALAALLTAAASWYATAHLGINTDTATLVPEDEPFRVAERERAATFPDNDDLMLAVVQDRDALAADEAARTLAAALAREPGLFTYVYAPGTGPYFERHGLLYLDTATLSDMLDRLAQAQPALAIVAQDPSLRGLFGALDQALEAAAGGEALPPAFSGVMEGMADAADAVGAGHVPEAPLLSGMMGEGDGSATRIVLTRLKLDFDRALPAEPGIERFRELAAELRRSGAIAETTSVRLTGEVVLAYEELESVTDGLKIAGLVSLVLLALILGWGLRSVRLIAAAYLTLTVGLIWTSAFAALTVRDLNMISASCAVLFIGLGIDYAIHFCLRYAEDLASGRDKRAALVEAGSHVGPALALCAVSSSIGFLSFTVTEYKGFADLGIIAAGGVAMAFVAGLSVLPALLAVLGAPKRALWRPVLLGEMRQRWRDRIAWTVLGLAVLSIPAALGARFDFSTLALKDPDSESVRALEDLTRDQGNISYAAFVIADDLDQAERVAERLRGLPEVASVITPRSYVPEDQDDKLAMIEESAMFMWPVFNPDGPLPPPTAAERRAAARAFLDRAAPASLDPAAAQALTGLRDALGRMLVAPDADARLAMLERALVGGVVRQIERLELAFQAGPVTYDDLPADLLARDIAPSGRVQVTVVPKGDMRDHAELAAFARAVTAVAPGASGRAIGEAGMGRVVLEAFEIASALTLVLVTLLLYAILRRWRDVLLVLAPLAVAGSLTAGVAVIAGIQFNFANVIVLPLILGFGIDSAVHLVLRRREGGSVDAVMRSSTPRAVTLSALTTIASFGSLSLSPHWGTASLGLLLTVAMVMIELSAQFVLPALMRRLDGPWPEA
jgi:hopanoid biosynthesis associated RND transporter like protein HpnN